MASESGSQGAMPAFVLGGTVRALGRTHSHDPAASPAAGRPQSDRDHATEA